MRVTTFVAVLAIFVMPVTAVAEDSSAGTCQALGKLAENIMRARQNGVSISKVMSLVEKADVFKDITKQMIIIAYDEPRWNGKALQDRAVMDFSNDIQLMCYKTID
ncbi:hypothetical protein [Martelella mangrovi]|uniref:Uncharacterized protein n=1 Tax=Martelella mangrovi TaxID=1397477 RepID=A0ABV2IGW9_9HYPH